MGATSKRGLRYPESVSLANQLHTRIKELAEDAELQIDYTSGAFQRYNYLCDYNEPASNLTGYLVIQTNLVYANHMTKLRLHGYTYDVKNNVIDLEITFYPYATDGNLYSQDYVNKGSWRPGFLGIYNRNSDGKIAIVIGADIQASYFFQYPKFVVDGMFYNSTPLTLAELKSTTWGVSRISSATLASNYTMKRDLGSKYGAGDDTGWIALPTTNSWVPYSPSFPARYKREAGWVTVEGLVSKTIAVVANDQIAVLPVGFRPDTAQIFATAVPASPYAAYTYMNPTGSINIGAGANASWSSLAGMRFKAYQ